MSAVKRQLSLFDHIAFAYADRDELDNAKLYREVSHLADISQEILNKFQPVGSSGKHHKTNLRAIRWHQQTLKRLGFLEHVEGKRAVWRLTNEGKKKVDKLKEIKPSFMMLAFSTRLGIAIWSDARALFSQIDIPITLCLSSPPYPLKNARNYGNPKESEYIDWICHQLEPIVKNLVDGGSIVLNISNDIFLPGMPARSLYRERLVIALDERFGLYKMDEIPWVNLSKAPAPVQWASINRFQLNVGWEPIYWFCNNPLKSKADNRRVLEPHSDSHKKYIKTSKTRKSRSDGAYVIRETSFANETAGKIPKNVLIRGHNCARQNKYRALCKQHNIPAHGAVFPQEVARFCIEYLSEKGDVVADPFGGSLTSAQTAEELERRWISTDRIGEYLHGGGLCFGGKADFNDDFLSQLSKELK